MATVTELAANLAEVKRRLAGISYHDLALAVDDAQDPSLWGTIEELMKELEEFTAAEIVPAGTDADALNEKATRVLDLLAS